MTCRRHMWGVVLLGAALCFVPSPTPSAVPRARVAAPTRFPAPAAPAAGVLAAVVGLVLSLAPAWATPAPADSVEAAWGFVKRNFYDQTYNQQDWSAAHERFLERARKGERAESIVRDMVGSLGDRYSRVIDAETFEQLMAFDPLGVGLVLARNDQKEVIVSSPPFVGSSAAQAGIKQGDLVDTVDGLSFQEQSLLAVSDKVAQKDAETVTLSVRPKDGAPRQVSLVRLRQAKPQNQVESGVVSKSDGHKIGYLRLRSVGARSALEMAEALKALRAEGAEELVLDLRGNGGGSFPAALEAAELFLPPGSVAAQVKLPTAENKPIRVGEGAQPPATEPLAVLVDGGSASASEVLAVALRGNCRAPLLGQRSFGKAAVQGVFGLPNKEAVALTVARYSGPGGTSIEGGLEPDLPGPGVALGGFSAAGLFGALGGPAQSGEYTALDVAEASKVALAGCKAGEAW
ncbi:unnamed protein product [Effrenium voratum]|nr:unnamed protein product [Effrenium voratum]